MEKILDEIDTKLDNLPDVLNSEQLNRVYYQSLRQLRNIITEHNDSKSEIHLNYLNSYLDYCLNFYPNSTIEKALNEQKARYYHPIIFYYAANHSYIHNGWSGLYIIPGLIIDLLLWILGLSEHYFYIPFVTITLYVVGWIRANNKRKRGKYLITDK